MDEIIVWSASAACRYAVASGRFLKEQVAMSQDPNYTERRRRQRFLATQDGQPRFWVQVGGDRLALIDLSLEGFSIPAKSAPSTNEVFAFEMNLDGIPDKLRGQAKTVNVIPGENDGQAGCEFVALEGDGAEKLHEWLTVHVIRGATVRISAKEAEAIVSGPSLI